MTNEEILKEQVQMLKELIKMKDELISELNGKIARLQSKSKIIQDLTDIPSVSPSTWTPPIGPALWPAGGSPVPYTKDPTYEKWTVISTSTPGDFSIEPFNPQGGK